MSWLPEFKNQFILLPVTFFVAFLSPLTGAQEEDDWKPTPSVMKIPEEINAAHRKPSPQLPGALCAGNLVQRKQSQMELTSSILTSSVTSLSPSKSDPSQGSASLLNHQDGVAYTGDYWLSPIQNPRPPFSPDYLVALYKLDQLLGGHLKIPVTVHFSFPAQGVFQLNVKTIDTHRVRTLEWPSQDRSNVALFDFITGKKDRMRRDFLKTKTGISLANKHHEFFFDESDFSRGNARRLQRVWRTASPDLKNRLLGLNEEAFLSAFAGEVSQEDIKESWRRIEFLSQLKK